jgi:hypothetical protein
MKALSESLRRSNRKSVQRRFVNGQSPTNRSPRWINEIQSIYVHFAAQFTFPVTDYLRSGLRPGLEFNCLQFAHRMESTGIVRFAGKGQRTR